jgi:hypothetical protein
MSNERVKWMSALGWVLAVATLGVLAGLTSMTGLVALAAFGLVPPCAVWFVLTPPAQTLSERISEARR